MIGRQDHRGELPEQLAELGTFSPGHEQHPQREEARCRVHLPMCWLPTGTHCVQRDTTGCCRVWSGVSSTRAARIAYASLPCLSGRYLRLSRGSVPGAVPFPSRSSMQWWSSFGQANDDVVCVSGQKSATIIFFCPGDGSERARLCQTYAKSRTGPRGPLRHFPQPPACPAADRLAAAPCRSTQGVAATAADTLGAATLAAPARSRHYRDFPGLCRAMGRSWAATAASARATPHGPPLACVWGRWGVGGGG